MPGLDSGFPLVLRRELRALLRSRRAFWGLVAAVAVTVIPPLYFWPVETGTGPAAGVVPQLVTAFSMAQLVIVLVMAPVITAASITTEREQSTWDLLLATRISAFAIVSGKVGATLTYVMLVLAATAPSLGAFALLGGVDVSGVARVYVLILAMASLSSVIAVAFGLTARDGLLAMLWSLAGALLIAGPLILALFPLGIIAFRRLGFGAQVLKEGSEFSAGNIAGRLFVRVTMGMALPLWWIVTSGLPRLLGSANLAGCLSPCWLIYQTFLGDGEAEPLWICVNLTAVCSVWLAALTSISLAAGFTSLSDAERLALRGERAVRPLGRSLSALTLLRLGERDVAPFVNAIFLRELRTGYHGRDLFFAASAATGTLLGAISPVAWIASPSASIWVAVVAGAWALLLSVATPLWASRGLTQEIENGSLDLLRSLPLSAFEVLTGQFGSAIYAVSGLALGGILGFTAVAGVASLVDSAAFESVWLPGLVAGALGLAGWAHATAASILAGAFSQRSVSALASAYGLTLVPFTLVLALPRTSSPRAWILSAAAALVSLAAAYLAVAWLRVRHVLRDGAGK